MCIRDSDGAGLGRFLPREQRHRHAQVCGRVENGLRGAAHHARVDDVARIGRAHLRAVLPLSLIHISEPTRPY